MNQNQSTLPMARADDIELVIRNERKQFQTSYGFKLITGHGRLLTSGAGFMTPASRDEAAQVAMRRVLGERPRAADPSAITYSCRAILNAMVNRTWGRVR